MTIAAANIVYSGTGPSKTGQVIASRADAGNAARILFGTVTHTGDAASATAVINYIDGTQALGFVPSAILASRTGGAATGTISVVSVKDNADAGVSATITFSANVNAATFITALALIP